MPNTHTATLLIVGIAAVATACGNSGEEGIEQLIENETGENVELDFEDGGINVETDEGSFTVDDEGNFTIVGEDGEVLTGEVDPDSGSFVVEGDEGEVLIEGDADGGDVQISGDDGEVTFSSSDEFPDDWPSDVPQPIGIEILSASTVVEDTGTSVVLVGTVAGDVETFVETYSLGLAAAGIPETGRFSTGGSVSIIHENDAWVVSVSGTPGQSGAPNQVSIFVAPAV